ncbi:site-2 protease family protein [bacterium]|nr:site-2 protease family protein [bacterium]
MIELVFLPVLIFAVVIHECAHGLVAKWCGDDTADREGRITLNPIKHTDLWGTIIIPVLLALSGSGLMFGWAKPVPVNPNNFRNYRRDDIYVSMAGPASNFILALISAFLIVILSLAFPSFFTDTLTNRPNDTFLLKLLWNSIFINIILAVFNLIPIPPLDGSHVIASFLPPNLADQYRSLGFTGMFILVALMATGIIGRVITPILDFLLILIAELIHRLLN